MEEQCAHGGGGELGGVNKGVGAILGAIAQAGDSDPVGVDDATSNEFIDHFIEGIEVASLLAKTGVLRGHVGGGITGARRDLTIFGFIETQHRKAVGGEYVN